MSKIHYFVAITISVLLGGLLFINTRVQQSINEPKITTPAAEAAAQTAQFDHSETQGRTVKIYFKTPIVVPSHLHIEPIAAADHEVDFGDGDTEITNNGAAMQRDIKSDTPSGWYRIRYKDCATQDDCETGFFNAEITDEDIVVYK